MIGEPMDLESKVESSLGRNILSKLIPFKKSKPTLSLRTLLIVWAPMGSLLYSALFDLSFSVDGFVANLFVAVLVILINQTIVRFLLTLRTTVAPYFTGFVATKEYMPSLSVRFGTLLLTLPFALWVSMSLQVHVWRYLGLFALEHTASEFFESLIFAVSIASPMFFLEMKSRAESLELEKTKSQLQAIQARLDPHFLFNTLNTIANSIEQNPKTATEQVITLSELYRSVLIASEKTFHSLKEELEIIDCLIVLEKQRFGEKLSFVCNIPTSADAGTIRVPPLMIHTLVENAIKHGVSKSKTEGTIHLTVQTVPKKRGSPRTQILVRAIHGPIVDRKIPGLKIGIASVKKRLQLLYGSKARFELKIDPNGSLAELEIP